LFFQSAAGTGATRWKMKACTYASPLGNESTRSTTPIWGSNLANSFREVRIFLHGPDGIEHHSISFGEQARWLINTFDAKTERYCLIESYNFVFVHNVQHSCVIVFRVLDGLVRAYIL